MKRLAMGTMGSEDFLILPDESRDAYIARRTEEARVEAERLFNEPAEALAKDAGELTLSRAKSLAYAIARDVDGVAHKSSYTWERHFGAVAKELDAEFDRLAEEKPFIHDGTGTKEEIASALAEFAPVLARALEPAREKYVKRAVHTAHKFASYAKVHLVDIPDADGVVAETLPERPCCANCKWNCETFCALGVRGVRGGADTKCSCWERA